jgi:energy-coupling factor transport system permease protein
LKGGILLKSDGKFGEIHIVTPIVLFLSIMIMVFSNDNPAILISVYTLLISLFIYTKNTKKLRIGILYFIPFVIVITIINIFFVSQGKTILFYIMSRKITLESIIYSITMAFKLLSVTYIFMAFDFIIDSDRAVSYFSTKMPKSTLMLMIGFKLVPDLKNRFNSLKDVYTVRGVNFDNKSSKEKSKSYIPVFSILLDNSLESSFEISEAAYVRGFLSSNRSIYERQKFNKFDFLIIFSSIVLLITYCIGMYLNLISFNVYDGIYLTNIFNYATASVFTIVVFITTSIILYSEGD